MMLLTALVGTAMLFGTAAAGDCSFVSGQLGHGAACNQCSGSAAQHGRNIGETCFGVPAKGKCTHAEVSIGRAFTNQFVGPGSPGMDVVDVGMFPVVGDLISDDCLDCVFVSIVNDMGGFRVTHEYPDSDSPIDTVNKQLAALRYCAPEGDVEDSDVTYDCKSGDDLRGLMNIGNQCPTTMSQTERTTCIAPHMHELSTSCRTCLTLHSTSSAEIQAQCLGLSATAASTGALLVADVSGGAPTNSDSFHVLDFALGSLSAALLFVVTVVVARWVRRSRQLHAPTPSSEEDSGKDDETAALTQAV